MAREVLIVGASVRAAAQSAVRAGWSPSALDQFLDEDLLDCCRGVRVPDYPRALPALARQFPPCPVVYTGALENHPHVIQELAKGRPLLGNAPEVVQAVRDPWILREKLLAGGCPLPALRHMDESIPAGDWLVKPRHSGGGIGIQVLDCQGEVPQPYRSHAAGSHYVQQFMTGLPISGLYVATGGGTVLLGMTRQLIGCSWAGARPFFYVGNLGPWEAASDITRQLQRIGAILAREFPLQGLFGVDAILHEGEVWTLEVNPRYTAAVEILERALTIPAFQWHVEACEQQRLPEHNYPGDGTWHGKAVLYARQELTVPAPFADWTRTANSNHRFPVCADLPASGTWIARGRPLCTVFAAGHTQAEAEARLRELAEEVYARVDTSQPARS